MKNEIGKKPMSFENLTNLWKKGTEFEKSYDDLEIEYEVALHLVQARVNAGLTQEDMATRLGTTPSVIARIESGKSLPTFETLTQYAEAIGNHLYMSLDV